MLPEQRASLRQRLGGPNRRPVEQLVAAAETSARGLIDGFGEYARGALGTIGGLIGKLDNGSSVEDWRHLYTIVHDLRASSATVGWQGISSVSASLERAIEERDAQDRRMIKVVQLHHDGMRLLIGGGANSRAEWQGLITQLASAVHCLPRKGEPAPVIALRPR
jgi:hypothetical protein